MKRYELTCLLSPKLDITQIKEINQKIDLFLDGEKERENLTKINLAYPIKKEGGAFLYSIDFKSSPQKITELQKKLKSENKILRFQILAKEKEKIPSAYPFRIIKRIKSDLPVKEGEPASSAEQGEPASPAKRGEQEKIKKISALSSKKKFSKKVELGKIDEKLKEILGE